MSVQFSLPSADRTSSAGPRIEDSIGGDFSVKAFAENFDVLVNAAGSTRLLKELVLQLAVRGRLLPDLGESAQSLVTQIAQHRARLTDQSVRLREDLTPVASDEIPYEVPMGWKWVRIGHLGGFLGGGTPTKSNAAFWRGPLPWVSPKDMKRPYIDDAEDHISTFAVEQSSAKLIPPQSVLFVLRGMILAHSFPVAVTTRQVTINQDMRALVLAVPALSEFVLRTMQAVRRRVLMMVERSSHGTCRLDSERVEMLPIALPPLAEQKRIVAKVDQLMALCDELETRQTRKRETGTRLTKAALETLTTAESPEDFDRAWKRIHENIDLVLDSSEKVQDVRRTILDLAVRGRFSRRTARTVKQGEPFAVPDSWTWTNLGALCDDITVGHVGTMASRYVMEGFPFLRSLNVGEFCYIRDDLKFIDQEFHAELKKSALFGGEILAVRSGNVGRSCVFPSEEGPANCSDLVILRPGKGLDPYYGCIVLNSPYGAAHVLSERVGIAQGHFNIKSARQMPTPTPPLAEQKRIVAKVEQLMKICDALEERLRRAEERAAKLANAAVQEVVA